MGRKRSKTRRKTAPARNALMAAAVVQAGERVARKSIGTVADEAATRAVQKTFLALGVDISAPDDVLEAQKDFAHMRKGRVASESRNAKITVAVIGTLLSIMGGVITLVIQRIFFKG